jgi:hypothetical protein
MAAAKKIIQADKKGITLLFVLGIMLLLLSLSVSVFTAAGLSLGAVNAQRQRTQLYMYASSMERVIMAALDGELGHEILRRAFWEDTGVGTEFNYFFSGAGAVGQGAVVLGEHEEYFEIPQITASLGGATYRIEVSGRLEAVTQRDFPEYLLRVGVNGRAFIELTTSMGDMFLTTVMTYDFSGWVLESGVAGAFDVSAMNLSPPAEDAWEDAWALRRHAVSN